MSEKQTPDPKPEGEDPKASKATQQTPTTDEKKTMSDTKASIDEQTKTSTDNKVTVSTGNQAKDSSDDQKKSGSADVPKKPKDKKEVKRQELKDNKNKESDERKAKRTQEMKLLSQMKDPQTITDEIQLQTAGYEVNRKEKLESGRASTIYGASKKDYTDSEVCCKLLILNNIPKPYANHLMKSSLKIQRYAGSAADQKAPKCQHFVRVFEMFLCQKKVYIFLERVQTLSLETRLRTKDTITEFDAKKWGKQLIEAIDCLQLAGVAHRNIRPENIVFDKQYNIKLVGFGVAVVFWDEKKQEVIRQPKEKPIKPKDYLRLDHMPVQCVTEETYDPSWVDIWSWAVFICVCLHKQTPFDLNCKDFTIEEQWTHFYTKYWFAVECKSLLEKCFATLPANTDPSKRISSYDILRHKWLADKKSSAGKKPESKKKGP